MEGGGTTRDHLKIRNSLDPRLVSPVYDQYDQYILAVLTQLGRDRPPVMEGIAPIPLQAILNYQTLFSDVLDQDEIFLIQRIDDAIRNALKN